MILLHGKGVNAEHTHTIKRLLKRVDHPTFGPVRRASVHYEHHPARTDYEPRLEIIAKFDYEREDGKTPWVRVQVSQELLDDDAARDAVVWCCERAGREV